jgi:CRISPR-associated endonuclease/helicase Cas3
MGQMFFAHSGSPQDESDWQALGKYDPRFLAYIRGRGPSVDHSTAGGAILRELAEASGNRNARVAAEVLAYCILGHHAGLPDRSDDSTACLNHRLDHFDNRLDAAWTAEVALSLDGVAAELAARMGPETPGFDLSVATRMVFSCLVDADFLDTEAFYAAREGWTPDREWPNLQERLPGLLGNLGTCFAGLRSEGDLNAVRREILAHVRRGAALPPGLFSLTVPTGGGKTLASLAFALDHAAAHGRRRIIYAIPFTSIIDQTASIFRDVLGKNMVLEHHSAIDEERNERRQGRDKIRLAMENWARRRWW